MKKDITWTTDSVPVVVGISDKKFCKSLSWILLFVFVVDPDVDVSDVRDDDLLSPKWKMRVNHCKLFT